MSEIADHSDKILRCIADGVITTDTKGVISYMNPTAEKLTGATQEKAVGMRFTELIQLHREGDGKTVFRSDRDELTSDHGAVMYVGDGQQYSVSYSMTALKEEGEVTGYVVVLHDLTNEYDLSKKLQWQMLHDSLTRANNRQAFELRIQNVLDGRYKDELHSLIYMDVDYFTVVNDLGGTEAGDQALRSISNTLQEQLQEDDLLCRVGGDEFAIILKGSSLQQAAELGDRLRKSIAGNPVILGGRTFQLTVSAGLVPIGDPLLTLQEVITNASRCCHIARDKGGDCLHVYAIDDRGLSKRRDEMASLQDLQHALEHESFVLSWQHIRPSHAGVAYDGMYEFMVYLQLPDGRVAAAENFVPVAEQYGLMARLDQWVIHQAFSVIAAQTGSDKLLFNISLSGQMLADINSLPFIEEQIELAGIDAECICFVVTETAVVDSFITAKRMIDALRQLGCRFALADFGTGLSSFAYLKHFKVDTIKIAGEFIRNVCHDRIDQAMVNTVRTAASDLGIMTIAENVESKAAYELLQDMGVDYLQGDYVSEPVVLIEPVKH